MEIDFVGERKIQIAAEQTILEASLRAGIPHFHACGGRAKCSTCRIKIIEGIEQLNPLSKREVKLRKSIPLPKDVRLACQTTTNGSIIVKRMIMDETDIPLYFKLDKHTIKRDFIRKPLGEERHLVLFFLDIRDFTPFVETHLPYDVIDAWRRLFNIFYKVITHHGGQIIETAGDQLYAVFGFRSSIKVASEAAIQAGQGILEELGNFNRTYVGLSFTKEFEVGIGVHAGRVIVGELHLGRLKKTSVMGLAVNIASRLQSVTKELNNSFIVSDEVVKHLVLQQPTQSQLITVKGVSAALRVHIMGAEYNLPENREISRKTHG